ncbi:MAG: hypothetical protein LAT61_13055 [Alcanivorax sp.]|nr:hypothetical protein [Alcanivorax sp.]
MASGWRGQWQRGTRWLRNNPALALKVLGIVLVVIIVLQNMEPTSVKILFWQLPAVPKLVLLLVAMAVGALLRESLRRRRDHKRGDMAKRKPYY